MYLGKLRNYGRRHVAISMISITFVTVCYWAFPNRGSQTHDSASLELQLFTPHAERLELDERNRLLSKFISIRLDSFMSRVAHLPYRSHGILNSEALALLSMCEIFDVTHVFESGTANGQSTEILATLLPTKVSITTIDFDKLYGVYDQTTARLSNYSNVNCVRGDSTLLLPRMIQALPTTARAAVFIDGPKAFAALSLAKTSLKFPQVSFVAIHDVAPFQGENFHSAVQDWEAYIFDTSETWYRARFEHLDSETFRSKCDDGKHPGEMLSQGYGLAVAIPQDNTRSRPNVAC